MLLYWLIFSLLLVGGSWAIPTEYEDVPDELKAEDIIRSLHEPDPSITEDLSKAPDEPDLIEDPYEDYNPVTSEASNSISSAPMTLTSTTTSSASTTPPTPTTSAAPTKTPITTSAPTATSYPTSHWPVTFARPMDNQIAPLRPIQFITTVQVDPQITLQVRPLVIHEPIFQIQQVVPLPYTQYVPGFPAQSPYIQDPIINHISLQMQLRLPQFEPYYQPPSYPIPNIDQANKYDDSISRRLVKYLMENEEFLDMFWKVKLPAEANLNPNARTAALFQAFKENEKFKQILARAYAEISPPYEYILKFVETLINNKEYDPELANLVEPRESQMPHQIRKFV